MTANERALYDLAADPLEQSDLYAPGDPDVSALWSVLAPHVEAINNIYPDAIPTPPTL